MASKSKLCALCCSFKAKTKDHIPPKSIFKKPRPTNLITVPSCNACNNEASKNDEYFLHFLTTSISPEEHSDIKYLLQNKTIAAIKRDEAKTYRKYFLESFSYENAFSKSGKFLGKVPIRKIEANRVLDVVKRIGKGLYYHIKGKPIPVNANMEVSMLESDNFLNNLQDSFEFFEPIKIGDNIFEYSSIIPYDCNISAGFYLKFYNLISFYVNVTK